MEKQAGIYIHIPFCERKCTYCSFNTTDFDRELADLYAAAVRREISHRGNLAAAERDGARARVDTIYFGGGTPSLVEGRHIASLTEACRAEFDLAAEPEITIEVNPASLSMERMDDWIAAGVNRVSVGVQSFIDRELVSLSRTHGAADARLTVESLRRAGFGNISIDLIAGLPRQSLEGWRFNLAEATRLRPEHMSLYLLEVKEGTQLRMQVDRGLVPSPDDVLAAEMYREMRRTLIDGGYEHYEISNFALAPDRADGSPDPGNGAGRSLRSRHNLKYWAGAPYYGVGCGAHSFSGRSRWSNILRTENYIMSIDATGQAVAERRELSDRDLAVEGLFMGLRLTEGISVGEFREEYGVDVSELYEGELNRLSDAGLIEVADGRLKLTENGILFSNEVFVAFL